MHKKLVTLILSGLISISMVGCGNSDELESKISELEKENQTLVSENSKLETENNN